MPTSDMTAWIARQAIRRKNKLPFPFTLSPGIFSFYCYAAWLLDMAVD
jgi:hypothetical protein